MGPYADSWKEYRRYLREFLLVWLGGFLAVAAIAAIFNSLFHTLLPGEIAAVGWILLFLITGIRYQTFRCPRCGNWFAAKWWYNKSFLARKCVHCGLPKFSDDGN
jgi:hypothetical protein